MTDKPVIRQMTTLEKTVVSILGTLVTGLLTWQIYTTHQTDKNVAVILRDLKAINSDITEMIVGANKKVSQREFDDLKKRLEIVEAQMREIRR